MIKLSLNSNDALKPAQTSAPFANTLAAAVEAAGAGANTVSLPQGKAKKQKAAYTPAPSNGLLTRGVRWLQLKGKSKKRLHMIETVSLGEKRFVALVKVDGREFLLGGAPSSVGMLADLGAHGLGELLGAAAISEATKAGTDAGTDVLLVANAETATKQAEPVALPVPATLPTEAVEPLTFALPEPVSAIETPAVSGSVKKLDVVLEAEENEADWLRMEENDSIATVAVAMPSVASAQSSVVHSVAETIDPVVVEQTVRHLSSSEKLGPVAVPPPVQVPAARMDLNFTFQMWPSIQPASSPAMDAQHLGAPTKTKKHIDLESCPELLGEPYVLALVNRTQGAAA